MAVQYILFDKKISCSVSCVPSTSGIFCLKNKSHYGWTQASPQRKRRSIGETSHLIAFTQQCFLGLPPQPIPSAIRSRQYLPSWACQVKQCHSELRTHQKQQNKHQSKKIEIK